MKDDWERDRLVLQLSRSEINDMIKPYFSGRDVVDYSQVSGGWSNHNYQIRMEGIDTPFLLRIYKDSNEVCQKEREVYRRIHQTVPVPEIYELDDSCRIYEQPFAIAEWVEGIQLSKVMYGRNQTDTEEVAASVGSVLADIHQYTFDSPGFFGADLTVEEPVGIDSKLFVSLMEDCLFHGKAGDWLGETLTDRLWRFVEKNAPLFSEAPDRFSLTHSDFNGWNLLVRRVSKEWQIAAVLDWEYAFSATGLVDIGNMLRYEKPRSPFEKRFIEGFESNGGKLPREWKKLSKLEDLIALVDLLNRSDGGENRIADLKGLIVSTLENWHQK